jgi:hypothetical protein
LVLEVFRSRRFRDRALAVPGRGLLGITQGSPNPRAEKKLRIEGYSQPQRCGTITRIGSALIEQAR